MSGGNQLHGVVMGMTRRGEWRTLLVRRESATEYEADHPDMLVIPVEVSPYVFKHTDAAATCDGAEVNVHFSLKGREYNGKHYVSVAAYKVECIGVPKEQQEERTVEHEPIDEASDEQDKLPF